MANPKITVLSEAFKGTSFELTEEQYSVGRRDSAQICIPDPTISGRHATFHRAEDGAYILRDENSTNGTWVNKDKLEETETVLKNGDIIRFGAIELLYDTGEVSRQSAPATHGIDLNQMGTLRLNDKDLQNLGNQQAAKKVTQLRENAKSNMIIYSALALFAVVIAIAIIYLLVTTVL